MNRSLNGWILIALLALPPGAATFAEDGPYMGTCRRVGNVCVGTCLFDYAPICGIDAQGVCKCKTMIQDICDGKPKPKLQPQTAGFFETIAFAVSPNSLTSGPWLSPGNTLDVVQLDEITVTLSHNSNWGGGSQDITLPPGILSATISVDGYDPDDESLLRVSVTSVNTVLPSFASVALNGGQTGDNVVQTDGNRGSAVIDLDTGQFQGNVYARFFNDVFPSDPVRVQAWISGVYDFSSNRLIVEHSPDAFQVVARSPFGEPLW